MFPPWEHAMHENSSLVSERASEASRAFGLMLRVRRKALHMTQDQLALATGVGRRFLIDLESGKTTCQLGLSLLVAEALGVRPADLIRSGQSGAPDVPELPSPIDCDPEYEGEAVG
jgi:transcriptional regulator with XRE-family HTH domain